MLGCVKAFFSLLLICLVGCSENEEPLYETETFKSGTIFSTQVRCTYLSELYSHSYADEAMLLFTIKTESLKLEEHEVQFLFKDAERWWDYYAPHLNEEFGVKKEALSELFWKKICQRPAEKLRVKYAKIINKYNKDMGHLPIYVE